MSSHPAEMITPGKLGQLVQGPRPLAVEFGEYASATTLLMEELGGVPFGAPRAWRRALVSELDARDLATLAPPFPAPGACSTGAVRRRPRSRGSWDRSGR